MKNLSVYVVDNGKMSKKYPQAGIVEKFISGIGIVQISRVCCSSSLKRCERIVLQKHGK